MTPPQIISFFDIFPASQLLCFFSTRVGGISKGKYHSLNLGLNTGDVLNKVKSNRNALISHLNISESQIAFTDQVHSGNVKIAATPGIYRETDALITNRPNLFLAIQTADCFPIFIYSPEHRVIAAIHAGWRGTKAGIIENTIILLQEKFNIKTEIILAVVGPGLQKECFEVEQDTYYLFEKKYLSDAKTEGKKLLDLKSVIIDKLKTMGLVDINIFSSDICTKCDEKNYYSYRRDKHQSGRMMGIIGLIS